MIAVCAGVFVASVIGSLHCLGMCGGFVAISNGGHLAYHGTRLVAYALLGALLGSIGAAIGPTAAWIAGGFMIAWGLVAFARLLGARIRLPEHGLAARLTRGISRRPPMLRAAILGLVSGLLPCGWLWAFVILAGGTGSPLHGALVMASFWAGTVPALLALGLGLRHLAARFRRAIPWVSAAAVLLIGVFTIAHRAQIRVEEPHSCCAKE